MKKTFLIAAFFSTCFCLAFPGRSYGQDEAPKEAYIAANIPDSLKQDANSVLRYQYDDITISGPGRAVIKHHEIVTILNEKGDEEAITKLPYNKKFATYSDISIRSFAADGTQLKKYRKGDMYDGAAVEDETMLSDERFLGLKVDVVTYPTTVEVEYELDLSSFLNPPTWYIEREDQSIQYECYSIHVKPDIGFRYISKNTQIKPDKKSDGSYDSYVWKASNLKAFKLENGAEYWAVLPKVEFGVNKFEYFGYPGDFSSWQNYGKWQQMLNSDVCTLNPKRAEEIRQMTAGLKTDREKAEFLYHYMQQNMRYVSIQLGIGGLKPFPADFVDQKKYGDCKALSNYMCALLKAVNIPSYFAIVRAGSNEEPSDPSFPNDIYNHVIVCVPFKGDTTWLECTSTTIPFGQLGSFTENRNALIITDDGGKLVNTPKSTAEENQFNSEVHLVLNADGGAKAQVKILGTGTYKKDYYEMSALKQDEQKEIIMDALNIKQPSVFDFHAGDDKSDTKEVDLNLEYDRFYDITAGDKQFYHPNVIDICNFTVPIEEKRKTDYYFEDPIQKSCSLTIDLPTGFEVETLPANQQFKFTYGSYEISYKYDAVKNQVTSMAKFTITNQKIPAAKYTELQQYLDNVRKAENKKLVIRRKA
jgi:transglutaminase-like putative cysteine protease